MTCEGGVDVVLVYRRLARQNATDGIAFLALAPLANTDPLQAVVVADRPSRLANIILRCFVGETQTFTSICSCASCWTTVS